MSDARALLAAERQARRITHPHLTYTKTGALICNICDLNIKSEQLWPGHLKSANHRKNVQSKNEAIAAAARPVKRKRDSIEAEVEDERSFEVDSRKKPRSASQSFDAEVVVEVPDVIVEEPTDAEVKDLPPVVEEIVVETKAPVPANDVDEDEWAAFEREVAEVEVAQPDYAGAIIEAAPISAAEVAQREDVDNVQRRENEAEAEKEDESRRMEDEFEVMEEMEDRVRKLRERREALRQEVPVRPVENGTTTSTTSTIAKDETSDSSDEEDDWYG